MLKKEFMISKGLTAVKFALALSWLLLFWLVFISASSDPALKNSLMENKTFLKSFPSAVAFVVMYLLIMPGVDPNHKADINSGWLGYSYALPVTPLVRTGSLLLYRLIPVLTGFVILAINNICFCAFWNIEIRAESFVYMFIFASVFTYFGYLSDFFTLRVRDKVEYKKYRGLGNFAMTIQLLLTFAIAAKLSGIKILDILDSEKEVQISLPHLTGTDLIWAIPLFVLSQAISFFILYSSLKSSYAAARQKKKQEAPADYTVTVKEGSPKGLFYLEFSQNKTAFILLLLMPFAGILLPFLVSASALLSGRMNINGVFSLANSATVLIVVYLLLFIGASILVTNMFANEGKKIWTYFIASAPGGARAYVDNKYLFVFILNLLFHTSCILANQLQATVSYFVTGKEAAPVSNIYLIGVFLFMFCNSMDIPLLFRFGAKKAGLIKMIIVIGLLILFTIVFGFLPEDIQERITEIFYNVMHGNIGKAGLLALGVFPLAAVICQMISAKLSRKIYIID